MGNTRWWDIAVVSTGAVLAALLLANQVTTSDFVWALVVYAAIAVVWFALGRGHENGVPRAMAASALIIVLAGVGTAITPSMATAQVIVFPLAWYFAKDLRHGIVSSVLVTLSVGTGYFFSAGADLESLLEALAVEGISLAGSLAIGLWITRISTESASRARLLDELTAAQDSLAALNRDAGVASERERLAREIHDTIAQEITGLVLLAQSSRRELEGGRYVEAQAQLDLLEESARTALAETRALVAASATVGLADDGIGAALTRLAERFGRETGTIVTLDVADVPVLGRDTEVVLLRCAQEGLANVRKHARAGSVTLELSSTAGTITLIVRDDGSGFDPRATTDGFGLEGMRDRLALVGGSLAISSSPAGTELIASLPAVAA